MAMNFELKGKRVLVTAGTKGVGGAVVALFRDEGAKVLTVARARSDSFPEELFIAADLTTPEGCNATVEAVRERLGANESNRLFQQLAFAVILLGFKVISRVNH